MHTLNLPLQSKNTRCAKHSKRGCGANSFCTCSLPLLLPRLLAILLPMLLLCSCGFERETPPNLQASAHAARMDMISSAIDRGDISSAQEALDKAFASGYQHPQAYLLQGRIFMARDTTEDNAASIPWFEKAIAASPAWVEPRLLLAQACIRDQRLRRAEQLFTDIDTLMPDNGTGPYGLALIASMDGNDQRATTQVDEALKRSPNYGPAILLRSELAGKQNDDSLQRQLLERYIALDPQHPGAQAALGTLYQKIGRYDDAWRALQRSYELQADTDTARRLADLASLRGDQASQDYWLKRAGASAKPDIKIPAK